MSLRALWARVRASLRRDDGLESEMAQEMEFHLDMATRRNIERGMTPAEARRQARLAFGSAEAFKEEGREEQRARTAENLLGDVRFALRSLGRSRSFAVTAVLTLGLGIGASTAIFTVVNALLLRPPPIPRPDDFTHLGWIWAKSGEIPALTDLQYEFVRDHSRALEAVAAYRTQEGLLEESTSEPVRGLSATGGFLQAMGFAPQLGRGFNAKELQAGGPPVVMLGNEVWRTRFAADREIVGRQIRLDGAARTVVGVLPFDFRFPPAPDNTGYVVPLVIQSNPADEGHNTDVIGRFRRGTSDAVRAAEMAALSAGFRAAYPALAPEGESFRTFTHSEVQVDAGARRTLWILFGAVSLVLLIACVNTATLLLVRASARQREIALRATLGAGRGRILQQLLVEGGVLSAIAATLGVTLSVLAVRAFVAFAPTALPPGSDPTIDVRVLLYAVLVSVATGAVFGLVAAGPAFRARLFSLLGGTRGATAGNTRVREALVFLETTVAVVLLAGATLLIASFARLVGVDPGFDVDRVVAVRLGALPADRASGVGRQQLEERLLERVRALPGVERAAAAPSLPLERGLNFPVDTPERPDLAIGAVELRFVSPGYLATLGVPLALGRDFGPPDAGERVAIVNEAFARHFWGETSAVGRSIQVGHYIDRWINPGLAHPTRVVGVAADIHELGLDRAPTPTVLLMRSPETSGTPLLLVRGDARDIADRVHDAVVAEEPQLVPRVEPLSAVVSRSVAEPRFRTLLVGAFAGFALLLTGIGIYGVVAAVEQQRRRELGIRLALGADHAGVAMPVVARCLGTVGAGLAAGLIASWALRRVISAWLFHITPGHPAPLAATVFILAVVAAFASWIPARRATRIDPATSLRLDPL